MRNEVEMEPEYSSDLFSPRVPAKGPRPTARGNEWSLQTNEPSVFLHRLLLQHLAESSGHFKAPILCKMRRPSGIDYRGGLGPILKAFPSFLFSTCLVFCLLSHMLIYKKLTLCRNRGHWRLVASFSVVTVLLGEESSAVGKPIYVSFKWCHICE